MNFGNLLGRLTVLGWVACIASQCATSGRDDSHLTINELAANKTDNPQPVAFSKFAGVADYAWKEIPLKAEWVGCKPKAERATVIVMHRDRAGYDATKFCDGWIAQTFLANSLAVISVNRPGFGNSNGRADFAGPKSVAAITHGLDVALKTISPKFPPSGIWGYSSGATAALFASKSINGLNWAIVGGGVYDLEETRQHSEDPYLKREIDDVKSVDGAKGLEDRSISYDVSGLPKRILIYHGKSDQSVSANQAASFGETLNANEYQATTQVIDGVGHDIPTNTHRQILGVLLHSVMK